MEYLPQVKVSKEDLLALSDLAGDMSIMDYMSKVIREHVAAQQIGQRTCATCGDSGRGIPTLQEPDGAEEGCVECGARR